MEITEIDVVYVQNLIRAELGPMLKLEVARVEETLTAQQIAFQKTMGEKQDHHHGENRVRLVDIAKAAETNGQIGAETLAKVDLMFGTTGKEGTVGRIEEKVDSFIGMMTELTGEVRSWAGQRKGEQEAEARFSAAAETEKTATDKKREARSAAMKWVVGLFVTGGAWKELGPAIKSWIHAHM